MADRLPEDEITPALPGDDASGVEPAERAEPVPSLRETIEAAARDADKDTADRDIHGLVSGGKAGDDSERPRDASGRFLPKDAAPVTAAAPAQSPASSDTPAAPSTAPAGPPPGWAADAKAVFSTLPPAVQQAVIKREQEVSAGFAQYSQRAKELEQVISPRRQYYANDGVSDTQAIDNIWKWFEALRHSPDQSFPALAQMFGYDLSTVSPDASAANSDQNSPYVRSLEAKVRLLETRVGEVAGTFEQQQTEARRAELAAFAKDKPHFEKVRVTMGRLMAAGVAGTLDDAYQQAVKLDPGVSAEVAAMAEKAAAEAALRGRPGSQRRAAVSVRGGSPNGAAGPPVVTSIRESLKAGFAEARGG